jgi:glycine/D-amino acid oxidase-like deaminating enzyme
MAFAPDYGLATQRLNRKQLEALMPECPARWRSALHTPDDGRAEPSLAVPAMARALRKRGVRIVENCAVEAILTANGQVSGVRTEQGDIETATLLCAGGAWSTFLLKGCGVRLPQLTVKASVARTAPAPLIFNGNASGSKVAIRRRLDGGYSVASSDYLEIFPSPAHLAFFRDFIPLMKTSWQKFRFRVPELTVNANFTRHRVLNPVPTGKTVQRIRARLVDRYPMFAGIEFVEAWSGMIDALPDVVPVLDQADSVNGLWISTGFSGHGFGIGPAAGKLMAERIQGNPVEHDLARFRLGRFSDGSELELGPSI